ncbi:MAG: B12-binding domain-containing radical SAM protein [Saprospirales bacterium]|jgi:anaerobic magnesium-protoporphyrin IX monomethyl ester cyclase|nr:B12-binding domain-containing radical SAM protein [Saprospirales bacterium]MBK8921405.1 B12-binding domain-containing radical SAM protein [Saprospirales bacterium]
MSRILFTHSYFYRFDPKQWKAGQPYPPYGTLCAAALLRECGFEVDLFDTNLRHSPDEILPVLALQKPKYLVLYDDGFNYLTKMCLTRMREAAFRMTKYAKAQGCTVLVSSSDSTDHYEEYLREGADFVLLGEGEITLRELILALESGKSHFDDIQGLAFLPAPPHNGPFRTPPRPVLTDLDSLPDPAWDLVDMEAYRAVWMERHGYFSLNLATTRGCPFKCNWCAKPIYGNRYNSRSPQRVAQEIDLLIRQYGVHYFWMADDIFGLKPRWAQAFRDIVREKGLQFQYKIQSRVDLLLLEDTISALAASGLRQVWVGAESGSQSILDAMDKGTRVEEIREATRLLKQKDIEVCFFLQFGYLGETMADIEKTIALVEELLPHDIGISVSYPLPGTKFYEKVKDLLGVKKNWTDSDDLAMMYPATFKPAFYRRLHRLVHKRFRLQQGLEQWRQLFRTGHCQVRRAALVLYYAPAALVDGWRLQMLQ